MGKAHKSQGFTLIATLLMLLLMSGVAIGLLMMITTEAKVGGSDLQNNVAYHNSEGAIEQMTSNLSATFKNIQSPQASDICSLSNFPPSIQGVTWKDYQVAPVSGCSGAPLASSFGQIQSGPNQGLYAQIIPVTLLATAAEPGNQEVSMSRTAQVALIPVFQFGIFSDSDLSFFSGPNFDFNGRVHTNGDLYPEVGTGSTITFHDKLTAYGNVVRAQLPNGFSTATNYKGTVLIPTASKGCDAGQPACRAMSLTEGSVTGGGGNPPTGNNPNWPTISTSNYHYMILNGNYGITPPGGTGAVKLSLPFVSGTTLSNEIIRRPQPGDSLSLSQSREYSMAQIRVQLSDDPAELSAAGAGDPDNVRLANVAPYQFGVATSVPGGLPALPAGSTYNTYFASASQALTDPYQCNNTNCGTNAAPTALSFDWPLAPAAHPAGDNVVPANAPLLVAAKAPAPTFTLCPPSNSNITLPAGCPAAPAAPYYATANTANASSWGLIDGWLRVDYKDAAGNWHPVTNEWLSYGFARGITPPTVPGGNPVNPSAILLLQEPADRNGDGAVDTAGLAPTCTATSKTTGKCTAWKNGRPPEVVTDLMMAGAGSTSPYFGITKAATVTQSWSMFNWYPINFYDPREGEIRDINGGNNTCAANGVMNAVELDVGNLKQWLMGNGAYAAGSGKNVDYKVQNGYVLYFSDRRGMLRNPNLGNAKTGDSGLEDAINANSSVGTPDGKLDGVPPGKKFSAEDVNQNGVLDNFGANNLGLGFYNGAANVNNQIVTAPPNPYVRINSCAITARKNWVSGARHVLRLVDGGYGNVPFRTDTVPPSGGFTVVAENPVYIMGNYNSDATDPAWAGNPDDTSKHAAAGIIADAVTFLSNSWSDLNSTVAGASELAAGSTTTPGNRNATDTYYRVAIAGGKNMNFPQPTWGASQDFGTDGGVHNFLRYIENWGGRTLFYKGSLVSLYYSTYSTGAFKCCTTVYSPPTRAYSFDNDFANPTGLPPGTPMFKDVNNLSYRQIYTTRTY